MTTAKKTAAKKATKKSVWDEQTSVQPTTPVEKVTDTPEEGGSPFGSMTPIMKLITGFREQVKKTPIEMNGRATAPDGTVYAYYLSEDVLGAAHNYCSEHNAFLDTTITVEGGSNIMWLQLTDIEAGQTKQVYANLGNPTSTADFGTRITYAPKYLVAMMFGISVQTDSDAFNNGKKIQHDTNNNSDGAVPRPVGEPGEREHASVGSDSGGTPTNAPTGAGDDVEHSQSYPLAKQFIERSLNTAMLDQAEQKVNKATGLHDFEKTELLALISEKRKTVS